MATTADNKRHELRTLIARMESRALAMQSQLAALQSDMCNLQADMRSLYTLIEGEGDSSTQLMSVSKFDLTYIDLTYTGSRITSSISLSSVLALLCATNTPGTTNNDSARKADVHSVSERGHKFQNSGGSNSTALKEWDLDFIPLDSNIYHARSKAKRKQRRKHAGTL